MSRMNRGVLRFALAVFIHGQVALLFRFRFLFSSVLDDGSFLVSACSGDDSRFVAAADCLFTFGAAHDDDAVSTWIPCVPTFVATLVLRLDFDASSGASSSPSSRYHR